MERRASIEAFVRSAQWKASARLAQSSCLFPLKKMASVLAKQTERRRRDRSDEEALYLFENRWQYTL